MFAMIYVGTGTQINTRYSSGAEGFEPFLTQFSSPKFMGDMVTYHI